MDPISQANAIAAHSGLIRENLQTQRMPITSWSRISPPVRSIRVYIEGDGFAWKSRTQPSDNPTPRNPVGLALAAADSGENVFYLARPCQFTGQTLPARCDVSWWTTDRFSPQAIDVMNDALDRVVARYPGVTLELVGYSGGGNIAALLAARRHDVHALRTVAGNLDVEYVNAIHHVTPMPTALSAINAVATLRSLPQIHYSGSTDTTVPPAVTSRYQHALGGACSHVEVVPAMSHGGDWAAIWPTLLESTLPKC